MKYAGTSQKMCLAWWNMQILNKKYAGQGKICRYFTKSVLKQVLNIECTRKGEICKYFTKSVLVMAKYAGNSLKVCLARWNMHVLVYRTCSWKGRPGLFNLMWNSVYECCSRFCLRTPAPQPMVNGSYLVGLIAKMPVSKNRWLGKKFTKVRQTCVASTGRGGVNGR